MALIPQSRASLRSEKLLPSGKLVGGGNPAFARAKAASFKRSVTAGMRTEDDDTDSGRVRVAVRLCPKNSEDLSHESDFIDCVESFPELKGLKLRKNNWKSESYRFDEVFTGNASQRRVYEVVAKPVVEVVTWPVGLYQIIGTTSVGPQYSTEPERATLSC